MFGICAAVMAMCVTATMAMQLESVVIDLTGVQFKNGFNQSRNSAPDSLNTAMTYGYDIDAMVIGQGMVMGALFPEPTPLAEALEILAPGSSAFLTGEEGNPGCTLPVQFVDERFFGVQTLLGFDITIGVTIRLGIDDSGVAFFSFTDVIVEPSTLGGSFVITTGQMQVDVIPCPADFNLDCTVNTLDVLAYLNAFSSGDPRADFNGDGSINTLDVLAFLNAFNVGC